MAIKPSADSIEQSGGSILDVISIRRQAEVDSIPSLKRLWAQKLGQLREIHRAEAQKAAREEAKWKSIKEVALAGAIEHVGYDPHKIYTEEQMTEMAKRAVEKEAELAPKGVNWETFPFQPSYKY